MDTMALGLSHSKIISSSTPLSSHDMLTVGFDISLGHDRAKVMAFLTICGMFIVLAIVDLFSVFN